MSDDQSDDDDDDEDDQPAIGGNALEALRRSQVQPESGAEEDQLATGGSASDRDGAGAAVARRSLPACLALSVLPAVDAAATTGDDADDRMNYVLWFMALPVAFAILLLCFFGALCCVRWGWVNCVRCDNRKKTSECVLRPEVVYCTPEGECWHLDDRCPGLAAAKLIEKKRRCKFCTGAKAKKG